MKLNLRKILDSTLMKTFGTYPFEKTLLFTLIAERITAGQGGLRKWRCRTNPIHVEKGLFSRQLSL